MTNSKALSRPSHARGHAIATSPFEHVHREWRSAVQEAAEVMEQEVEWREDESLTRRFKRKARILRGMLRGEPVRDEPTDSFSHGFLCAMAALIREHDQPSMAADIIKGAGMGEEDISFMDPFDRDPLLKLNDYAGTAFKVSPPAQAKESAQ